MSNSNTGRIMVEKFGQQSSTAMTWHPWSNPKDVMMYVLRELVGNDPTTQLRLVTEMMQSLPTAGSGLTMAMLCPAQPIPMPSGPTHDAYGRPLHASPWHQPVRQGGYGHPQPMAPQQPMMPQPPFMPQTGFMNQPPVWPTAPQQMSQPYPNHQDFEGRPMTPFMMGQPPQPAYTNSPYVGYPYQDELSPDTPDAPQPEAPETPEAPEVMAQPDLTVPPLPEDTTTAPTPEPVMTPMRVVDIHESDDYTTIMVKLSAVIEGYKRTSNATMRSVVKRAVAELKRTGDLVIRASASAEEKETHYVRTQYDPATDTVTLVKRVDGVDHPVEADLDDTEGLLSAMFGQLA